jgi:hypothetical protein
MRVGRNRLMVLKFYESKLAVIKQVLKDNIIYDLVYDTIHYL